MARLEGTYHAGCYHTGLNNAILAMCAAHCTIHTLQRILHNVQCTGKVISSAPPRCNLLKPLCPVSHKKSTAQPSPPPYSRRAEQAHNWCHLPNDSLPDWSHYHGLLSADFSRQVDIRVSVLGCIWQLLEYIYFTKWPHVNFRRKKYWFSIQI